MNMLAGKESNWNGDTEVPKKFSSGQVASPGSDVGLRGFAWPGWHVAVVLMGGHRKWGQKGEMWSPQLPYRAHQ